MKKMRRREIEISQDPTARQRWNFNQGPFVIFTPGMRVHDKWRQQPPAIAEDFPSSWQIQTLVWASITRKLPAMEKSNSVF